MLAMPPCAFDPQQLLHEAVHSRDIALGVTRRSCSKQGAQRAFGPAQPRLDAADTIARGALAAVSPT
jgi:hypothetical protein